MDVPIAANVLGTIGAVCWSVQLIPQIIINYRRHDTTGLQPSMMMLWAWAGVPLGVYNIVKDFNIALQIQPQILTALSLATWIQCYYYGKRWSIKCSLSLVIPIALFMGGIEAGLIFGLRAASSHDIEWPMTVMAILSALLLALGVLRHYWDIWVHRTVRGISFIFVGIDAAGDLFSLLSVFFQPKLDVLGLVIYGTELALWLGVFACGGYYNFRPWFRRKLKARHGALSPHRTEVDLGQGAQSTAVEGRGDIALHDLPSSTSVFRTSSSDTATVRSRPGGLGDDAIAVDCT